MMKRNIGMKLNSVGPPLLKRMKPCIQETNSSIFGSPRSNRLLDTIAHIMLSTAVVNTFSNLMASLMEESTTFWRKSFSKFEQEILYYIRIAPTRIYFQVHY